jgi:hypothetical protein
MKRAFRLIRGPKGPRYNHSDVARGFSLAIAGLKARATTM